MRWENVEVSRDRIALSTFTPARSISPSTGDHGPLQRLVHRRHALGREARLQHHPQPQGDVRVLGGVLRRLVERHLAEGLVRLLGAGRVLQDLLEGNAGVPQVALGKRIHPVLAAAAVERIGEQHGVVEGAELDAVPAQHEAVVLEVLPDLEDRWVLQQRLQQRPAPP